MVMQEELVQGRTFFDGVAIAGEDSPPLSELFLPFRRDRLLRNVQHVFFGRRCWRAGYARQPLRPSGSGFGWVGL